MSISSISLRLLFSKKQFSYTNISIFLSLSSFMLAICISLLVIGVSRGYKNNVELEISNIEPDLFVSHSTEDYISSDIADSFINQNITLSLDSTIYAKYITSHAMIKKKSNSKGIFIYAMEKEKISKIFNFNYLEEYNDNDDFLFISKTLYNQMNFSKDEEVYIFNIEKMIQDESIKGIKIKINGMYNSNIRAFDEKIIFISLEKAKELLDIKDESYTGLMVENINDNYLDEMSSSSLSYETWEEKHYNLLNWLMIFANPIKLILVFILLLSVIYKIFAFWLILYDKSPSLNYLKILGFSNIIINRISFHIIIFLSFFSIISGSLLALLLSAIQNNYELVAVNPDIYILSNIKSIILMSDIIYLSLITLFILILSTRIVTYFRFKNISVDILK